MLPTILCDDVRSKRTALGQENVLENYEILYRTSGKIGARLPHLPEGPNFSGSSSAEGRGWFQDTDGREVGEMWKWISVDISQKCGGTEGPGWQKTRFHWLTGRETNHQPHIGEGGQLIVVFHQLLISGGYFMSKELRQQITDAETQRRRGEKFQILINLGILIRRRNKGSPGLLNIAIRVTQRREIDKNTCKKLHIKNETIEKWQKLCA